MGRCWFQAPEVDGVVVLSFEETDSLEPGKIYKVRLVGVSGIDLKAVLGDELSIDPHAFFPDGILRPASGLQHLAQRLIEPHAHSSSSSLNSVFMSIFSARRSCGMLPCST